MRSSGNLAHPPDARLVSLLGIVSDHFGGRKIEVISGFRPYTPTQHTRALEPQRRQGHRLPRGRRPQRGPPRLLPHPEEHRLRLLPELDLRPHGRPLLAGVLDRLLASRRGAPLRRPNADADDSTSDVAEESDASSMAKAPANAESPDSDDEPSATAPAANPAPPATGSGPATAPGASAAAKPTIPGAVVPPATR